jgi:hypothetical protein
MTAHSLGKGEVESSILSCSTSNFGGISARSMTVKDGFVLHPSFTAPPLSAASGRASSSRSSVERGIRILELDPVFDWYSDDPVDLPTALVVWAWR